MLTVSLIVPRPAQALRPVNAGMEENPDLVNELTLVLTGGREASSPASPPAAGAAQSDGPPRAGGLEAETVSLVREAAAAQDKIAVLFAPDLLGVAPDDLDSRVDLFGLEGNLRAAFDWSDNSSLRLDLLTAAGLEDYAARGYRVIQAVRDPESTEAAPLLPQAIPLAAAEAIAHYSRSEEAGRNRFLVDVGLFNAGMESLTLPEVLSSLEAQFSA